MRQIRITKFQIKITPDDPCRYLNCLHYLNYYLQSPSTSIQYFSIPIEFDFATDFHAPTDLGVLTTTLFLKTMAEQLASCHHKLHTHRSTEMNFTYFEMHLYFV